MAGRFAKPAAGGYAAGRGTALERYLPLLGWMLVVVAAVLAGYVIVTVVRRWAHRDEKVVTFTFQDLREMRATGSISEAEFNAMRNVLLRQIEKESSSGEERGKRGAS